MGREDQVERMRLLASPVLLLALVLACVGGGTDSSGSSTATDGATAEPTTGAGASPCSEYRSVYREDALAWCACSGIDDEAACFMVTAYPLSTCACAWLDDHPADDAWMACQLDSMTGLRACDIDAGCNQDARMACSDADATRQEMCGQPSEAFQAVRFDPCP